LSNLKEVEENIKPNTKAIWIETPTNPTLKICDIKKVCALAKENNIISVVDNTFLSPVIQSPLLLGADFCMNSCTKYMGGHSDILMGSLTTNSKVLIN
jgi:cystathionine gamma-lyase / homocysteine desulfhydrase